MKAGRPTIYTEELAAHICREIESGRNLQDIVEDDGMPARYTINRWINENPTFSAAYYKARRLQADFFADEIVRIAKDDSKDWVETRDGSVQNNIRLGRTKLTVESYKWLMTRVSPEKWGDKVEKIHSGNPNNPVRIQTEVRYIIVDPLNLDTK